jgi:hypothetical protein
MSAECLNQLEGLLLMMLCFPFGGKLRPSQWCSIYEPICDLENELIQDPTWSRKTLKSWYDNVILVPDRTLTSGEFTAAKPLAFNISISTTGSISCYINDICTICMEMGSNAKRCAMAVTLALDAAGPPLDVDDRLLHEVLALKKLHDEGCQAEVKIMLGWELNSCLLNISLIQAKFQIWFVEIQVFLDNANDRPNTLKSSLGRLESVTCIISHM